MTELTPFEEACDLHSDMYKEVNNFRPRRVFESLAHVEAAIARLQEEIDESIARRDAREQAAARVALVAALLAPFTRWQDAAAAWGAAGW